MRNFCTFEFLLKIFKGTRHREYELKTQRAEGRKIPITPRGRLNHNVEQFVTTAAAVRLIEKSFGHVI